MGSSIEQTEVILLNSPCGVWAERTLAASCGRSSSLVSVVDIIAEATAEKPGRVGSILSKTLDLTGITVQFRP